MEFDFQGKLHEAFARITQDGNSELMPLIKDLAEIDGVPEQVAQLAGMFAHQIKNQQMAFLAILEDYHQQLMDYIGPLDKR